uniref:Uncharacterized protein n=1 Tax=Triticum urartu TaxID=4572 RepID=A0A8R7QSI6_TRIUA
MQLPQPQPPRSDLDRERSTRPAPRRLVAPRHGLLCRPCCESPGFFGPRVVPVVMSPACSGDPGQRRLLELLRPAVLRHDWPRHHAAPATTSPTSGALPCRRRQAPREAAPRWPSPHVRRRKFRHRSAPSPSPCRPFARRRSSIPAPRSSSVLFEQATSRSVRVDQAKQAPGPVCFFLPWPSAPLLTQPAFFH